MNAKDYFYNIHVYYLIHNMYNVGHKQSVSKTRFEQTLTCTVYLEISSWHTLYYKFNNYNVHVQCTCTLYMVQCTCTMYTKIIKMAKNEQLKIGNNFSTQEWFSQTE